MTSGGLPSPPPDLGGEFLTDEASLGPWAGAAGPYRHPPRAVALPADADDVRRLVRWAAEDGAPLVPRGGGTGMPGGNVGPGVVVDLSRHLRAVEPVADGASTIRAEAGATGATVARAAARRGLFLPPMPSSAERCTVGGMVANNAAGARSFRYGAVRDWVLEVEVVTAEGVPLRLGPGGARPTGEPGADPFRDLLERLAPEAASLLDGWPRVRKNSSGYALDRFLPTGDPAQLLVGSEGTLGVVTAATFRLAPEPASRTVALLAVEGPDTLVRAVAAAEGAGAAACEFLGRPFLRLAGGEALPADLLAADPWALLLVELEGAGSGADSGVGSRLDGIVEAAGGGRPVTASDAEGRERIWEVRHAASPAIARRAEEGLRSMQFVEDCVVPPSRLGDFLVGLEEILDAARLEAVVFGHAGDANVHVNPLVPIRDEGWRARVREVLERTTDLVAGCGGTMAGEHGDGRLRAPLLPRIWSPAHVDAFRTVKETLDPEGILNPGTILPLSDQDPLADLDPDPHGTGR